MLKKVLQSMRPPEIFTWRSKCFTKNYTEAIVLHQQNGKQSQISTSSNRKSQEKQQLESKLNTYKKENQN